MSAPLLLPVLALIGDRYHAPEILEKGLAPLRENGAELRFVARCEETPWQSLDSYRCVLLSKGGYDFSGKPGEKDWLGEKAALLARYVEGGGGLFFLHSGLAGYDANPLMLSLARATFTHHPEGLVPVEHTPLHHPLAVGGRVFSSEDEQYFVRFTEGGSSHFLETGNPVHGIVASGWSHTRGEGRIACLSPGHTLSTLLNPEFQTYLENCLRWCAN